MTDFVSKDGVHFDDFNDNFNYIVCINEAVSYDDNDGKASEWLAKIETVKIFEPENENEALNYSERLKINLSEFPKGSYVSISSHKSLFDKIH